MRRITVCYGRPTDPAAFDSHYAQVHVPLVRVGHVRYRGVSGIGRPALRASTTAIASSIRPTTTCLAAGSSRR
jgi:uncharacterized protein (TIGR02118 family)